MKTVNIHDAKTNLSKLVEAAVQGEPFVIARAGKPMVKVMQIDSRPPTRIGFLDGAYEIPEDFDRMDSGRIRSMFEGDA
ncbi:type II toxin-antitoxin system Phd/YefM family antitoxin [Paracoccus rhizosphaerae]|uniref:Antitoxin n=1 Tax=Paracoccus rhizosphaerae TaxID=1133347 RepID=A0ABV6CFC7_9RHOB|nr:type II toxin-antitoxin system prevent-host-death family antitoxin [Paracoccus rhizosphaerae]